MFEVKLPALNPERKAYRPAALVRNGFDTLTRSPQVAFAGNGHRHAPAVENIWWAKSRDGDFYPQLFPFGDMSPEDIERYLDYWA